jgi:hypothetical protein
LDFARRAEVRASFVLAMADLKRSGGAERTQS